MSYKAAWSKIKATESHLNLRLVQADGRRGSRVTEAGKDLLLPDVDLIVAEGYKNAAILKVEVFRATVSDRPCCTGDPQLIALVTDDPVDWSGQASGVRTVSQIVLACRWTGL